MGSDNLKTFHKWKNYQSIFRKTIIFMYPRPSYNTDLKHSHIHIVKDVPRWKSHHRLLELL